MAKLRLNTKMNCLRKAGVMSAVLLALSGPAKAQEQPNGSATVPGNPTPAADANTKDYWAVEDPKEREKLPLYKIIPAAKPEELTPANGEPNPETFLTWHRSHGDNGGRRYSALDQINRGNVARLQQAWIYHSGDGSNNLQCNPIIVGDLMIAPTAGGHVAAVNGETGKEVWRFKPEGRPAFRGLIYWPGTSTANERVLFCAGKYLYALDPKTGNSIVGFGAQGRTELPGKSEGGFGAATAGPAMFQDIIVVPGFLKDVWGFNAATGEHLWTFHTVPHAGEFGYETWDHTEEYAANCWAGMAMDDTRGIAYISTAAAKPNFTGVTHLGDNLFANCLIALDARTGKRLWHFQLIPHDIWDLDISGPPNLATITRNGRKVDVVAATSKGADTLLLDRVTGKPIFPFRMRRAPTSDLPGEITAPYQPDLELPEHFNKLVFTAQDLTDRTPESAAFAATAFKSVTTGFFRPASLGHPNVFYGIDGGAEWSGACVDPEGRLYISANNIAWMISVFRDDDPPEDFSKPKSRGRIVYETTCASCHGFNRMGIGVAPPLHGLRSRLQDADIERQIRTGKNGMPAFPNMSEADVKAVTDYLLFRQGGDQPPLQKSDRPRYNFNGYPRFLDNEGYPACKPPWGTLNCLDLNTGKLKWTVPLGEYPELTAQGVPKTGTENYGGAIVTAGGLLFCSGTRDSKIRAFDKDNGAELWSGTLPWVGSAPPTTYTINGRQYVVIASTGNKLGKQNEFGDAYVAFALPANK